MNRQRMSFGLALAVVCLACLVVQPALAAPEFSGRNFGKVMTRGARVVGSHGKGNLPDVSRVLRNSGRTLGRDLGRGVQRGTSGGVGAPGDILGALGNLLGKNSGNWGNLNGLNGLSNYPFNSRYGNYGRREDEMAKAYRQVGIANAIVGLVGIAAQAAQDNRHAQPAGQWVRERVLVSPARYETSQVWIPESFNPRTGVKIGGGYYETRTQFIPEVYQEREVRIITPAPPSMRRAPSPVPYGARGLVTPPRR